MSDCPIDYKTISYRGYVDYTFLLFSSESHVTKYLNYMNSKHRKYLALFLRYNVSFGQWEIQTSVYRKPTFIGALSNFGSFQPISYKYNLVSTLLHFLFMICFFCRTLHFEILKLKRIFWKQWVPYKFYWSLHKYIFR